MLYHGCQRAPKPFPYIFPSLGAYFKESARYYLTFFLSFFFTFLKFPKPNENKFLKKIENERNRKGRAKTRLVLSTFLQNLFFFCGL